MVGTFESCQGPTVRGEGKQRERSRNIFLGERDFLTEGEKTRTVHKKKGVTLDDNKHSCGGKDLRAH